MTQEEKQLLLKDLSARLPYGVKISLNTDGIQNIGVLDALYPNDECIIVDHLEKRFPLKNGYGTVDYGRFSLEESNFKPYLRPMSSMTDEEREEWADLFNKPLLELEKYSDDKDAEEVAPQMFAMSHLSSINWLYSKHFNIILPKEIFIEVTEENNPYKK